MTTVYVLVFHDVWDNGEDPGENNENGLPEETSVEGVYGSLASAEAARDEHLAMFPAIAARSFHTIEEEPLIP